MQSATYKPAPANFFAFSGTEQYMAGSDPSQNIGPADNAGWPPDAAAASSAQRPYSQPSPRPIQNSDQTDSSGAHGNQVIPKAEPVPAQQQQPNSAHAAGGPYKGTHPIPIAQPVNAGAAQPGPQTQQPGPQTQGGQPTAGPKSSATPQPATAAAGVPNRPAPANRPVPVAAGGVAVRKLAPEQESEDEAEAAPDVVKVAPPWLVSLIVHILILIVAALVFVAQRQRPTVDILVMNEYAEEEGEQLEEEILDFAPMDQVEFEEASLTPEDLKPVEDPLATPPQTDISLDATSSMSEDVSPNIGMALTGREPGMKKALLAAYGGNATTEAAVKNGLLWLKKNQRRDGSWSLVGPYQNGGNMENRVAATAMALLAFQGAGHTHQKGEFKEQVAEGWDWLLQQQHDNGSFIPADVNQHHQLYTHAQATIALCELYGMTEDSRFRDAAQRAIAFSVSAQSEEGGWRYFPKRDADTSVTGWFVMALQSALMAKLEVPSTTLMNVQKFLDTVAIDGGRRYEYQPGRHENLAMSAEGLLCRQYLGWKQDDQRLRDGVSRIVANPVDYSNQNVYYWYYATQAAHHMEGSLWDRWNRVMRQEVPEHQVKDGPEAGSWSPMQDEWGARGAGRLYTTCLSIYMLEVYYRHLPIYAEVYKFRLRQF